jgi:MFS family permease
MDPLEKAITDWFVKKRGMALGLGRVGLALGGTIGPPVMTILLINLGWRTAFLIAGFVTWLIGIPLSWFLVRPHRPEFYGLLPDGVEVEEEPDDVETLVLAGQELAAEKGEVELTLRQALRTRAFWIYVLEFVMIGFIFPCVNVHMIPHLTDMGVDPIAAATAIGFMTLMSAPARLVIGPVCDRVSIHSFKYIRMIADSLRTTGLFLFMISRTMPMVYLSALVYGVGLGFSAGSMSPLRGRFFGRKAFSTIHGTATMLSMPASIIAPIYVGWVYDTTNSYTNAFIQACILGIIAVMTQFFLKPPEKPEVGVSDIKQFL